MTNSATSFLSQLRSRIFWCSQGIPRRASRKNCFMRLSAIYCAKFFQDAESISSLKTAFATFTICVSTGMMYSPPSSGSHLRSAIAKRSRRYREAFFGPAFSVYNPSTFRRDPSSSSKVTSWRVSVASFWSYCSYLVLVRWPWTKQKELLR